MRFQVIQHLLAVLLTLFSSARSPHRVRSTPPAPPPQSEPRRINPETDLVYLGAFKLPKIPYVSTGYPQWSYGGSGATYNPDHNSIYAVGYGDCTVFSVRQLRLRIHDPAACHLAGEERRGAERRSDTLSPLLT